MARTIGTRGELTNIARACFAEFLGTLLFAWLGSLGKQAAFGNGLSLATMIFATASVSGGHLNPAVTASAMATREIGVVKGTFYILSQLLGGIVGAAVEGGLSGTSFQSGSGPSCVTLSETSGVVFGYEYIMTFVLVFVVFATAVNKSGNFGQIAPLAIGIALYSCADAGGDVTGAYLNPARYLGPALVYGCNLDKAWAYLLAQILGGVSAAFIYKTVMMKGGVFTPTSVAQTSILAGETLTSVNLSVDDEYPLKTPSSKRILRGASDAGTSKL
mmetsp:Transcript_40992/g.106113  ORF Transcript_40992/g.106113 Transcript_40992/m.106113 type:complete len:274 (-) Transcript_40992:368-1189(-)